MLNKFTKNTLITFTTRLLTLVLGIGISIIIARALGPEGKGIYSLVILLPSLLIAFNEFGINIATTYYIGKKKYSPQEVFGNDIIISFLISILSILVGLVIIFFFSQKLFSGVEKEYLLLALFIVPFTLFSDFTSHILIGLQKIKKYNIIYFLESLFFLILVGILLLKLHFKIGAVISAQIISLILSGIILFLLTKKETSGIIFKLNKQYLKDSFYYGFKVYLGGVFYFLQRRVNLFLINIFINPIAVGFYSVALGLSEGIWLISQSAAIVLFPKVASETNKRKLKEFTPLVCRNILLITLSIAILLFIFGYWIIVLLYSEKFLDSIRPFQILLIGVLSISGLRILSNDISARGKPIINTYIMGFSVILNIILNILLIPKWGIVGAAWATSISYFVMFMITIFIYSKISENKIKDIIFLQKSDLGFYKNFILSIRKPK